MTNIKKCNILIVESPNQYIFTWQTIYPLRHRNKTNNLGFCFHGNVFRLLLTPVFVIRIPAPGFVSTALCVSQSRCTTVPFRFMQIAELGEMHTSVRVGDSRSFVSVKSVRALQPRGSGELPKIECRANLTSV